MGMVLIKKFIVQLFRGSCSSRRQVGLVMVRRSSEGMNGERRAGGNGEDGSRGRELEEKKSIRIGQVTGKSSVGMSQLEEMEL